MRNRELSGKSRTAVPRDTASRSVKLDWLRAVFGLLSPAGPRGRLTILMFHRVHEQRDDLFPNAMHAATFRERMLWIRAWFNVLPLEEAVTALGKGMLPARALAITFDDGYADNCTIALPILHQLGLHATFFISTAFLDGSAMFNDVVIEAVRRVKSHKLDLSAIGLGTYALDSQAARRAAIDAILQQLKYLPLVARHERTDAIASIAGVKPSRDLMMTSDHVRSLAAAGMGIGGHTMKHPILAAIDHDLARHEIAGGRDALEGLLRQPVKLFAYPNGKPGTDYAAVHVAMVKDLGFSAAVSTSPGAAHAGSSLYELPRFTPWDRTRARWGWRLARNLGTRIERAAA
jgi:peptidoglycan/xylan/chitin deacetylase (PgdA/CDA1 family)